MVMELADVERPRSQARAQREDAVAAALEIVEGPLNAGELDELRSCLRRATGSQIFRCTRQPSEELSDWLETFESPILWSRTCRTVKQMLGSDRPTGQTAANLREEILASIRILQNRS